MSVSGDSYSTEQSSAASTTLSTQTSYLPHAHRSALLPTAHCTSERYPRSGPAGVVGTAVRPAPSRGEKGIIGRSAIGRRGAALVFPPSGAVRDEWDDDDEGEGWDKVVLERELDIAIDESLLPSLNDENEMLPSQVHPSYPTGQPYKRPKPYVSAPKLSPLLHTNLSLLGASSKNAKDGEASEAALQRPLLAPPPHLLLRAATDTANQSPDWPFKRFGPGHGGISALRRNERRRPQRPQRELWAEIALAELLPVGRERDPLKALEDELKAGASSSDSDGEGDSSDSLLWRTGIARAEKLRAEAEQRHGERDDAAQEQMEREWESRAPGGEAAAPRISGWGIVRASRAA